MEPGRKGQWIALSGSRHISNEPYKETLKTVANRASCKGMETLSAGS